MFNRLDPRAVKRLSGPSWEKIRPQLAAIHATIIAVSPTVHGDLVTTYVKYTSDETGPQPFAVLWVASSAAIVLGLALPDTISIPPEAAPSRKLMYKGLTGFFRFGPEDGMAPELPAWAAAAYNSLLPAKPTS